MSQAKGRTERNVVPGPAEIRRLLAQHDAFLDPSVGKALTGLEEFLGTVRGHGFSEAARRVFGEAAVPIQPLDGVEYVADRLVAGLSAGPGAQVFNKAVQEAFLDASGLEYDLEILDVDWGMKKFLRREGVAGFLRQFLELYVFYSIWICIPEHAKSVPPNEEAFRKLMSEIHDMSQDAVSTALKEAAANDELGPTFGADSGVQLMSRIRRRVLKPAHAGSKSKK